MKLIIFSELYFQYTIGKWGQGTWLMEGNAIEQNTRTCSQKGTISKRKEKVMLYGWCDCSYSANRGSSTYPVMSRHRRVWQSGLLCWGRRVERRPPHCRSERSRRHHSRRRGWWGCWCCWGKAIHCPRWRSADSKQIALVSGSHFSWWEWKLCCLRQRKSMCNTRFLMDSVLPNLPDLRGWGAGRNRWKGLGTSRRHTHTHTH